tara:strand:+ start:470 stop:1243 length:774 start_codon:yes stop_codon:yes gene_type:complete
MKRELLREYRSGQKVLNSLKNIIATDIMKLIKGDTSTSVPAYTIGDSEVTEYLSGEEIEAEPVSGYSLEGYPWGLKIDVDSMDLEEDEEIDSEIDVSFFFIRSPKIPDFNISGYDSTYENLDGIHIQLELNEDAEVEDFLGQIRTELGNTIRHELEHVSQKSRLAYGRDKEYYSTEIPWKPETDFAKNQFLAPQEVAAHVRGYADSANSIEELEVELMSDLENYVKSDMITPRDRDLILMVYLDWAKRHLKSKKFNS